MRIIIAGAGEVGFHLAKQLSSKDHDITIIDLSEQQIEKSSSATDVMSIHGSSTSIKVLKEARIDETDLVVAVTSTECVNISTAILAKKLGAKETIARVSNAEYVSDDNLDMIKSLGIDYLIYPEELAAKEIVKLIEHTAATDIVDIEGGKLSIVGIKIDENVPVLNMTMQEISEQYDISSFRVATINRDSETIIPSGENRFKLNDQVFIITTKDGIHDVMKIVGKDEKMIHRLMILGGGKIGRISAKLLEEKFQVKLIESNSDKALDLADYLRKTLIIEGDGRDLDLLAQEAIIDMDAFISVTEDAETNIITSLMAKHLGVTKTIAQVDNSDYVPLTKTIGLDSLINKKLIAANVISRFIKKSNIVSSLSLSGMDAEVLEYVVKEGTPVTKEMVKDLKFPQSTLVGGYIRNNNGYITIGTTQFETDDKVVVFALASSVDKVNSFFN
ncbi:MAG: Trk system potassium transporter TrkA [Melioribacteraceae bacterium]|jgi:trk system potassium uptake protein TrkA|nr:Trk system potassium transporter TrkA [Melioribacteraceae bacterium]